MSDIGDEHLAELTDLINDRLKEFELHNMQMLTVGHTRIAHDEIKRFYQEREVSWAMQRISDVTITAEMALKLSEQGYERGLAAAKRELDRVPVPTDDNIHRLEAEDKRLGADDGHPLPSPAGQVGPTGSPGPLGSDDHGLAGMGDVMDRLKAASNADPPTVEEFMGNAVEKRAEIIDALNSARAWEPDLSYPTADDAAAGAPRAPGPYGEPLDAEDRWDEADEQVADAISRNENIDEKQQHKATALAYPGGSPRSGGSMNKPRTLAEVDRSQEQELSQIITAIQQMAVGGHMPSVAYYNQHKPADLPVWQSIIAKHDIISWGDLADMCDLTRQSQRLSRPEERMARVKPGPSSTGQPTLAELEAHLNKTAMGGVMPRQSSFDDTKPAGWARASSQCTRLGITWEQLAAETGLKPNPRGPQLVTSAS